MDGVSDTQASLGLGGGWEGAGHYGLGRGRISRHKLRKYWPTLNLDPLRRQSLSYLLWPRKS